MIKRQSAVIICLILMVAGCSTHISQNDQTALDERDKLFAITVAAELTLGRGLSIEPDKSEFYAPYGSVDFFVHNHTGHDLCFQDDAFGVRGFVFNEEQEQWEEIDLGFTPIPSGLRCLRNEVTELSETWGVFPTQWVDTRGHSEVRLLVIGIADTGERYGAYADIRIVEGGTVVPTPTTLVITLFPSPTPFPTP
jgi:hypothetical protein